MDTEGKALVRTDRLGVCNRHVPIAEFKMTTKKTYYIEQGTLLSIAYQLKWKMNPKKSRYMYVMLCAVLSCSVVSN